MARILDLGARAPGPELLSIAVGHLDEGGFLAMPTETVYGFSCHPAGEPLRRLVEVKRRGADRPFLLLIPGGDAVPELGWSPAARALAQTFWPGALTLILRDDGGRFPPGVRSPGGGVAVRVSPHPLVRMIVGACQCPLVSTSANVPGAAPARSAGEALEAGVALGMDDELLVLDGGLLEPSKPSTIVDCMAPGPVILREGALSLSQLRTVLPDIHETT